MEKDTTESSEPFIGRHFQEYQPMVSVAGAFMVGILADRAIGGSSEMETSLTAGLIFWAAAILLFWSGWNFGYRRNGTAVGMGFLLLGIGAMGGAWHHLYWNVYPKNEISLTLHEDFSLALVEGKILRPPESYYASEDLQFYRKEEEVTTVLRIQVLRMKDWQGWVDASGRLLARVQGKVSDFHAGDTVTLSGKLLRPAEAKNPGGFSPRLYYRQERIHTIMQVPSVENIQLVERPKIPGIYRIVEFLRDVCRQRIEKNLAPSEQSLANALVLGCREEISRYERDTMLETGTIHLMSISGLHVGMLAGGFFLFLRLFRLESRWMTFLGVGLILLYVMITGARPPAVRAGVLVVITTLAFSWNRQASSLNSLATAALVVLFMNPTALFSTGTQLSFLAVGTLIYTPLFRPSRRFQEDDSWEYWFVDKSRRGKIFRSMLRHWGYDLGNVLYTSFLMMVVMTPLVVYRFHVLALVGLVLNVLLWLPLMVAMLSCVGVLLLGWIPGLGSLLGMVCSWAIFLMKELIFWGGEIPGHCLWMQGIPVVWIVVFYVALMVWVIFSPFRLPRRKQIVGLLLLVMALLCFPDWMEKRREGLCCSFLSISHGLAVLVELPDGRNFLFDAGQFAPAEYPLRTIADYLWHRGIHRLDAIFISHPDMDHYNAIPGLLERFTVDAIYVSAAMKEKMERSQATSSSWKETAPQPTSYYEYRRWRETPSQDVLAGFSQAIQNKGVVVKTLQRGDWIPLEKECSLEVLHPGKMIVEENTNANSLVLLLKYGSHKILLTGDLAPPGLADFLRQEPVACTVLQSPHHGGKTCNTPPLARWTSPQHVVISESFMNRQEATTQLFQSFGATVYHTGREGAVLFQFSEDTLEVLTRDEWKEE